MTLGGLSLAVGTTVDVGIVVVESIMRHLRMGKSPAQAAQDGTAEVAMPALAGTFTTLIVFIPVIFLSGMIKYLFAPLSVAATMTIGASYFVGMTVVPIFCARFVRGNDSHGATTEHDDPSRGHRLLCPAAAGRDAAFAELIAVMAPASSWLRCAVLSASAASCSPPWTPGPFEIRMRTLPGTRLEETEKVVVRVEEAIKTVIPEEEIATVIANIGLPMGKGAGFSTVLSPNSGSGFARFSWSTSTSMAARRAPAVHPPLRQRFQQDFPQEQFLFVSGGIVNAALNEGSPVPINIQVSASSLEKCREWPSKS